MLELNWLWSIQLVQQRLCYPTHPPWSCLWNPGGGRWVGGWFMGFSCGSRLRKAGLHLGSSSTKNLQLPLGKDYKELNDLGLQTQLPCLSVSQPSAKVVCLWIWLLAREFPAGSLPHHPPQPRLQVNHCQPAGRGKDSIMVLFGCLCVSARDCRPLQLHYLLSKAGRALCVSDLIKPAWPLFISGSQVGAASAAP